MKSASKHHTNGPINIHLILCRCTCYYSRNSKWLQYLETDIMTEYCTTVTTK